MEKYFLFRPCLSGQRSRRGSGGCSQQGKHAVPHFLQKLQRPDAELHCGQPGAGNHISYGSKTFLQLGDIFKQEKNEKIITDITEDAAGYDRKPQRRPEI